MNVVLCGMMGSGKTTVGKSLSQKLGRLWYDTDELIVQKYGKITDIFDTHGEDYFREKESEIIRELSGKDNLVLSTGGGVLLKAENTQTLKSNGKIVYLRARAETLLARLQQDTTRPLLKTDCLAERVTGLLKERARTYENGADIVIDVDGKSVDKIVEEIVNKL